MGRRNSLLYVLAGLTVLACLVFLAIGAAQLPSVEIGAHGWIALALGTVLSVVVGGGLSAILIISRRRGYDEAAHDIYRQVDPNRARDEDA